VDTRASAPEIARRLSISSLEVERVIDLGVPDADGNLGLFKVGKVVEAGKHPNADRLQLCRVDVGEGEPRQIVCGAWNFGAGATVAVALPGALLPGAPGPLEERPLRGELSRGMILSAQELELGDDHTGILVLDEGPEPGTPLADVLPISEQVLDVTATMNRVDLLSVYGLAREVAALCGGELRPMPGADPAVTHPEWVDVTIEDKQGCPRYIGRIFRDVTVAPSPAWLRARLEAAGMRAISNVVDVTNYVMLAFGSPLHAFDLDTLAGLMGGQETEVTESTTSVLLEAANFEPIRLLKSSERLALRTEGSNRWEKGVDPYLAEPAAVYASQLIAELTGARMTGVSDVHDRLPERSVVHLRPRRSDAVIGLDVPEDEQRSVLTGFGFEVGEDWQVTVPTWRARDVTREIDLVEEVARAVLDRVPHTLPLRRHVRGRLTKEQRLRRLVEDVLVGAGFDEAYTWSLCADDPHEEAIRLPDPMTSDQAILRTTLLTGLVEAARGGLDAGADRVALFEIARVYLPSGAQLPEERWRCGGIVQGGYPAARGALETIYGALHVPLVIERDPEPAALAHPGRAGRTEAGVVAELHPALLEGEWGSFELDLQTLFDAVSERIEYEDVLTFPALVQDLAVTVDEAVEAGALVAAALAAAGPELRGASVFDVYRGEQVGEGRKSIALRLTFQSPERTLTDEEAADLRGRIVEALRERFGAEPRVG
jgi:phenylalanyl-tRNA synthetase beta chain